jgi:3-keto-disaccharide hydrolase
MARTLFRNRWKPASLAVILVCWCALATGAEEGAGAFLGSWAFALPDGNPAWLELQENDGKLEGALLWSVGSARPVADIAMRNGELLFQRNIRWKPYGKSDDGRVIRKPMRARIAGDRLELTFIQSKPDEAAEETTVLTGKRMPPMPPRPDLSRVRFSQPVTLFNGRNLEGWRLSNPDKTNGWKVVDGVLVNETPKTDFGAYGDYGNLRTNRDFEDFRLLIEYNAPAGGNSGIYLRGAYEVQVVDRDSKMQGINGPGAVFGRIEPSANAGNPGGEWNRYELTLVDRHITVVLNGRTVIDNQPLVGCTGGGISADDTRPGPILIQGDHTSVKYRNIVIQQRER